MTNYKTTTTTQNKFICQAIKKDGKACKYKAKCGSLYCGVHKNFIDTSKTLFTEEEEINDMPEDDAEYHLDLDDEEEEEEDEEAKKGTYKFMSMTGVNYEITQNTPTLQVYAVKEIKRKYKIDFMTDVLIFEEGKEEPLRKTDIIYADTNNLFVVEQIKANLKEDIERVEPFIIELLKYSIKQKIEKHYKTPTKAQFNIIHKKMRKHNTTYRNWATFEMSYLSPNNIIECSTQIDTLKLSFLIKYNFLNPTTVMDTIFNRIITTNKLDQYETYY